ncbi:MAG: hypothetical protein PF904_10930 [Kiritimatiellae bacterium]|jgi:hypothetical protein|nr:hypothetical protein [Kiritimatiellia bacterium]
MIRITKTDWALFIFIMAGVVFFFAMTFMANAQTIPPHVIKGYMTSEDSEYWYHLQTLSNGSNKVHKVRKPKPPNPYISRQLIATNDLPVQVQYVYRILFKDLTVRTNTVTRTKTARERINIKLPAMPPMPEIQPRGKSDALGHALKRKRKAVAKRPTVINHKTMARRDPVLSRKVVGNDIHHIHKSGKLSITPLKRIYTARVASAPITGGAQASVPTNKKGPNTK